VRNLIILLTYHLHFKDTNVKFCFVLAKILQKFSDICVLKLMHLSMSEVEFSNKFMCMMCIKTYVYYISDCRDDAASRRGRENIVSKGPSFESAERAYKVCIPRQINLFQSVHAGP
jgi:hypothetical protein